MKEIFKNNGYREGIFDRVLGKFIDKKFKYVSEDKDEEKEKYVVLVLPYLGYASDEFKRKLCKLGKQLGVNTRIVFNSFKVGQYFSLKDTTGSKG